jgi:hypothetical protein
MAYSQAHAVVNQWDFLTGSLAQLRAVWQAYHICVQIQAGQIDHTPALYVIDQRGREQKVYLTTMAYASVGQEGQVLADEVASLLPGRHRPARGRVRRPGPAVVRAHLGLRQDRVEPRWLAPGARPGGRRPEGLTCSGADRGVRGRPHGPGHKLARETNPASRGS